MFDPRPEVFALPGGLLVMALGVGGFFVGAVWLLRVARRTTECDPRSFRATHEIDAGITLLVASVVAVIGLLATLIAIALLR